MSSLLHKMAFALAAYGPWGIFVLAAVDSLGVPLPAAVDLLVAGTAASCATAPIRAYWAAAQATVGSLAGNIVLSIGTVSPNSPVAGSVTSAEFTIMLLRCSWLPESCSFPLGSRAIPGSRGSVSATVAGRLGSSFASFAASVPDGFEDPSTGVAVSCTSTLCLLAAGLSINCTGPAPGGVNSNSLTAVSKPSLDALMR